MPMVVSKGHRGMPHNLDEADPAENLRADLAALPLPGPAIVIDVRSNTSHALPLVWDVAKELEDLTTESELNHVPRWRFLASCMSMLRISSLPPLTSLDSVRYFEIMTEEDKTQVVSEKQKLVDLVFERINSVRTNRSEAIEDSIDGRRAAEAADPAYAAVRVFFLVDMKNETSMRSATSYANLLLQRDKDYGDPEHTGRLKRLKTIAICVNADPAYRKREFAQQWVAKTDPLTIFAMLIFVQSYRDDDAPVKPDARNHEMELILYTLLLVSPEQLDTDHLEEQDVTRHIMRVQGHKVVPTPCPIYMLGISSTEYSGRGGICWLNYSLVETIIKILQDPSKVEQGKLLLHYGDDRKNWLDEWWSHLEAIAPRALPVLLPGATVLDAFQRQLTVNPFQAQPSLSLTLSTLGRYCQDISTLYEQTVQMLQQLTDEEPPLLTQVLQKFFIEYREENVAYKDEAYTHILNMYTQATCFLVTLFQNPAGVLPRAARQLSELATLLNEREKLAQLPDVTRYRELFEIEVKRVQQQLAGVFKTRHSIWQSLSGQNKQYEQVREEALKKLRTLAQSHLAEVRTALTAQLGFTLLEQAGLYSPDGKIGSCIQHIRKLDIALEKALERAVEQRKRAGERSLAIVSNKLVDMQRQVLNSRRDILPFQQVQQSYQALNNHFTTQNDEHLKALGRCLLYQVGVQAANDRMHHAYELQDNLGQLQRVGTELVAAMLSASAIGFDLTHIQSLANRYLDLPAQSVRGQATLVEDIILLQQIVKEAILEQSLETQEEFTYQVRPMYRFALKHFRSAEDILATWVELQYVQDKHLMQILSPISITTRLKEQRVDFEYELEDLQRRGRLLGHREQAQLAEIDHFYLNFLPGPDGDEFAQVLNSTRITHIERIHFPDREKLIYLHVHRIRSELFNAYSSPGV
jgi:hypothetical protein